MIATEHDYLVMDVADLPLERRHGDTAEVKRFTFAVRSLPRGKALLVPIPEGAVRRTFQVKIRSRLRDAALVAKTRFDYERDGFWVWLEAKS